MQLLQWRTERPRSRTWCGSSARVVSRCFGITSRRRLSDADVAALNEMMSFRWFPGRELSHCIQLPSSLQSLTFGCHFNRSLEGIQLLSSLQSSMFGYVFNKSLERIQLPRSLQSSMFPEHGGHPTTKQPAELVGLYFQQEHGGNPVLQRVLHRRRCVFFDVL